MMLSEKKSFLFFAFLFCLLLFSSSCDTGNENQDNTSEIIDATVSGAAQKGPYVIGSLVFINQLTRDGQSTGNTYVTQTTDNLGNFNFQTQTPGPVKIVVTGYHLNELTGNLSSGTLTLQSVYEVTRKNSQKAYVNILTHLISERVLNLISKEGLKVSVAVETAESELVNALNAVLPSGNASGFSKLNIYERSDANPGNAYLLALSSIFYQYASTEAVLNGSSLESELTYLLNTLSSDFSSDGKVDEASIINGLAIAESMVKPEEIKYYLEQRSLEVSGAILDVADMNLFIDSDGDGIVNSVDPDDDNDGIPDLSDDEPYTPYDNSPPVADAGPDQNIITGSIVILDGSGSSDLDSDIITYSWTFKSIPPGSSASLSDSDLVTSTFTADVDGIYEIALEVSDGREVTDIDTILVTATTSNWKPVADAGADRNVLIGSTVTLDGSASFDLNGDPITYLWTFSSVPQGSVISDQNLSDSMSETPSFMPDVTGTYIINLTVNDGVTSSETDTVTIGVYNDMLISDVYIADVNLKNCITSHGLIYASSLTSLYCNSGGITDVTGISSFPNLSILHLYDNDISDLSPLSNLLNLTDLRLAGNYNNLGDITPLSTLTNLTILSLGRAYISDVTPLSTLVNLRHLYLYQNQIEDISALSGMSSLIELSIGNNNIVDISPLAELTNLEDLLLSENNIVNISALEKLTKVDFLLLGWNQISDLTPISDLTNLTYLRLDYNQISDISPLSNLVNLNHLLFPHNNVADLSPLSNLTRLAFLSFGSNYVSDISPLSNLTTLTTLYISYNEIKDVGSLSTLVNLESVNLNFNAIESGTTELVTLINAANIYLSGNYNIPCADLAILEAALPGVVTAPSSCK